MSSNSTTTTLVQKKIKVKLKSTLYQEWLNSSVTATASKEEVLAAFSKVPLDLANVHNSRQGGFYRFFASNARNLDGTNIECSDDAIAIFHVKICSKSNC